MTQPSQQTQREILLTWVGARDPGWNNPRTGHREPGPILALLGARRFDAVYLLLNLYTKTDDFRAKATQTQRLVEQHFPGVQVRQKPLDLVSVIDYREIYHQVNDVSQKILAEEGREGRQYFVYLSPGTPQMQTVWVLLVQSGLLPATLLDSTPPDLVLPGGRRWREVELDLQDFLQVVSPGEAARALGVLQAQNDNLAAQNRALLAELELLRAGAPAATDGEIREGFSLRAYLEAQERARYVQALEQADGNAAEAARLLGLEPPAVRARAVTLGVRARRPRSGLAVSRQR